VYRDIIQCLESQLTVGIFFINEQRYFVEGKMRDSFAYRRHEELIARMDSDTSGILLH